MSDLRDFRAAIDEIEVNEQQKKKMYSNIIAKAESRRRPSFASMALKLAPALSLCLIVVISIGLIMPSFSNKGAAAPESLNDVDLTGKEASINYPAESDEQLVIDGVTCTLTVYDLTETDEPDGTDEPTSWANTGIEYACTVNWTEDGKLYVLSSNEVTDLESLLKIKDHLVEQMHSQD